MKMNTTQKFGVFAGAALIAILVLLHGPWDGYAMLFTSTYVNESFWDYHTLDYVLPWFAYLKNVIACAALVIGLTGLWCYLFRSPEDEH